MIEKKENIVDWNENKLDDISFITMGQSPSSSNYNDEKIGMPLLQGNADIFERKTVPRKYTTQITKICNVGDILISVRAPVGTIAISKHNAVIGRGLASIKAKDKITSEFLFQYLLSMENKWNKISQGSTFNSINSSDLKNVIIPTPTINEQKKIADILSTWDNSINNTNNLINKIRRKKKSIVSKIYGGEILENNKINKEYSRLKSVLREVMVKNKDENNLVLSVSNSRGFIPQSEQFEREVASKNKSNYKVVKRNQFAYNPSRINVGSIDMLTSYEIGILSPMYVVFEVNEKINNKYLYHFLKSDLFLQMIPSYTQGSVRDSLSFKGLSSIKIYLPEMNKQIQYAKVLDILDNYIEKLSILNDLYNRQKQGLMQQLLTGKIRVNTDRKEGVYE